MATFSIWSLGAGDVLCADLTLAGARRELNLWRKQPEMHRYFPATIELEQADGQGCVVERHTLGSITRYVERHAR